MVDAFKSLDVRPRELLCVVCRLGAPAGTRYHGEGRLDEILDAARRGPLRPMTLRCNVESLFAYQNPGRELDTSEGELFNDKRDLDVMQRLGLAPGDTRPAIELFRRLLTNIPSGAGICGYGEQTSETWRGCHLARTGNYERGHALGMGALIPERTGEEKARAKKASVAGMYDAEMLEIRPHHLLCMTCFHAGRKELAVIEEDNAYEAIDIMQKNPEVPVRLVAGPCMICAPCSGYREEERVCASDLGMGLRDQKKDLDVLQLLGLAYGDVVPACELLSRLYDKVRSTQQVCGYGDGVERGREWRVCREPEGAPAYEKGRAGGLGVKGVSDAERP